MDNQYTADERQLEELELSKEQLKAWGDRYSKYTLSEEQVQQLKSQHGAGKIIVVTVCNQKVYFLDPNHSKNYFHTAKRVLRLQQMKDMAGAGEVIFNECYLGGIGVNSIDEKINEVDRNTPLYFSLCVALNNLMELHLGSFTTA
jgi:hypothetical protein